MSFRLKRRLSLLALILVIAPTITVTSDAYAVSKYPRPAITCFAAKGIDPHGLMHSTYFYRLWMAKKEAATWISEG